MPAKYPILGEQIRKVWRGGGKDEYPVCLRSLAGGRQADAG